MTWVWVDFENTPHVLFLEPFIRRLRANGWVLRVSAKPQGQTLELARARGIEVEPIGSGDLSGRAQKIAGGLYRAAVLAAWVGIRHRPRLMICSSRTAALAALVLRIPIIGFLDYEHAEHRTLALASRSLWLPDILRGVHLHHVARRVTRYFEGLKENLYLDSMTFDRNAERRAMGVDDRNRLVVARPPATTAHYARGPSYPLWVAGVRGLINRRDVSVVVSPRTERQGEEVAESLRGLQNVEVLKRTIPGPGIVAGADLVLGGGGTMNREAAVLGVPVWSVFTGPTPHIDDQLAREGRLRWVRTEEELRLALRDEFPERMPGRGPFPRGVQSIMEDVTSKLSEAQTRT